MVSCPDIKRSVQAYMRQVSARPCTKVLWLTRSPQRSGRGFSQLFTAGSAPPVPPEGAIPPVLMMPPVLRLPPVMVVPPVRMAPPVWSLLPPLPASLPVPPDRSMVLRHALKDRTIPIIRSCRMKIPRVEVTTLPVSYSTWWGATIPRQARSPS